LIFGPKTNPLPRRIPDGRKQDGGERDEQHDYHAAGAVDV
jgi:hypothetical protein